MFRTGEWEYVAYRPDKSHQTTPQMSGNCAACHTASTKERDFTFRAWELPFTVQWVPLLLRLPVRHEPTGVAARKPRFHRRVRVLRWKSGLGGVRASARGREVARIKDIVRAVPTCRIEDAVAIARERAEPWKTCMIVNAEGVVLGRMYGKDLEADPNARVGDLMSPGPSPFRPNMSAIEMLEYMDRNDLGTAPVTTPDGKLVGLVVRADVERAVSRKG